MKIGSADTARGVFIVAEAGNNHEGSMDAARELVRAAAASQVDAVKFQTFLPEHFVGRADEARFRRLSGFQLSFEQFAELERLARSLGIGFISTALDLRSARFLEPLVDAFKIASGDNDFYPLIDFACASGKPIILSAGMTDLARIKHACNFVRSRWKARGIKQELAVLHCVSSYPAPHEQAELNAVPFLAAELGCTIGYSDHTVGPEASVAAVSLGARVLEKHFTLDKNYSEFRDHQLSADPDEMKFIVRQVRRIEALLGERRKVVQACETDNDRALRRSIAAGAELPAGHRLALEDLTWLRPGTGMRPGSEDRLIGKRLRRDVRFGQLLAPEDVE